MQKVFAAHQLPAHLTEILDLLRSGVEVVITENRRPVARMLSVHAPNGVAHLTILPNGEPESGDTVGNSGRNNPEGAAS